MAGYFIKNGRFGAICLLLVVLLVLTSCAGGAGNGSGDASGSAAAPSGNQEISTDEGSGTIEGQTSDGKNAGAEADGDDPTSDAGGVKGETVASVPAGTGGSGSAEDVPSTGIDEKTEKVTLSIVSDDGSFILEETEMAIEDGDTVLDVLVSAGKANKIPVVYSGTKKAAYVEGIDNIFEFDKGPESGWVYLVNGKTPSMGCGDYALQDGDLVTWRFVTSLEEAMI